MHAEDIKRTLTQQAAHIVFLTQLPHSIFLRVVHTITQVTPQLGKTMRLDGKVVGCFGTSDNPASFMTAPENMFRTFKVRVPPVEVLTTSREWANGNVKELFQQDENHTEVEVGKLPLFLQNGQMNF